MELSSFFKEVRNTIHLEKFDHLHTLPLSKPKHFNWVRDVFEPLNVEQNPQATALIMVQENSEEQYTFQEISDQSNQFLNFLRKHDVTHGDRVFTQLPLVTVNWQCYLAAIKGGLTLIPAAYNLNERDIVFRFKTLFPEVVVTDAVNAPKIDAAEEQFDQAIKLKILIDGSRKGWHSLTEVGEQSRMAEAANTQSDDPLFYFFTSGTTGLPKIVTHTHFTYPVGHLTTASWIGLKEGDVHYNISAPGWAKWAWSSFFAPWNMGATIFAKKVDKFDAIDQLKALEKYQITTFCAPPTVLRMMILEDFKPFNLRLRQCVAAGEPLNPDVINKWTEGTGTIIRDGYGQSETTCLAANLPGTPVKYGSMGKATFLYDLIIADDEGKTLPPLEEGHICIQLDEDKPNGVFVDYLGDSQKMQEVFKNGLYYTGDKAYKDEDGYIWFVGRNDDVIKASDYRIGPFEVESIMIEFDGVVEAAVVASPHPVRGYAVKAFLVLEEGITPSEDLATKVFQFAEENMALYKIPRILEFKETLPKTISGKIRRVELRANEAQNRSQGKQVLHEYFHEKY